MDCPSKLLAVNEIVRTRLELLLYPADLSSANFGLEEDEEAVTHRFTFSRTVRSTVYLRRYED